MSNSNLQPQTAEDLNAAGKLAYKQQEFAQTFEFFQQAAEQGFAEAQVNLGVCYFEGMGVEVNYEQACKLFCDIKDDDDLKRNCFEGLQDALSNEISSRLEECEASPLQSAYLKAATFSDLGAVLDVVIIELDKLNNPTSLAPAPEGVHPRKP